MRNEASPVKVLVATDGSEPAVDAARHCARLIPNAGPMIVVAVIEPTVAFGPGMGALTVTETEVMEQVQRSARIEAQAAAERTARVLPGTSEVMQRVETGIPGEVICRLADELQVDVVVVGSRGLGALKRMLLGSVSSYVVGNAPCPVLVVRDSGPAEDGGDK